LEQTGRGEDHDEIRRRVLNDINPSVMSHGTCAGCRLEVVEQVDHSLAHELEIIEFALEL
jgi:hypothetical protein